MDRGVLRRSRPLFQRRIGIAVVLVIDLEHALAVIAPPVLCIVGRIVALKAPLVAADVAFHRDDPFW